MPGPPDPTSLFAALKQYGDAHPSPDGQKDDWNYAANWMKHGWGADEVEIKEWTVKWAISKYCSVYGIGTPEMVALFPWAGQPMVEVQPIESNTLSRIAPVR